MDTQNLDYTLNNDVEIIRMPVAGRLLRLLNLLVDSVVMYLVLFIAFYGVRALVEDSERYTLTNMVMGNGWTWWETILIQAPFSILYYTLMEVLLGRTVGKMATSTRVVSADDGGPITWGQGLLRSVVRLVPFEFIVYLFRPTGLHDMAGKSLVIDESPSANLE